MRVSHHSGYTNGCSPNKTTIQKMVGHVLWGVLSPQDGFRNRFTSIVHCNITHHCSNRQSNWLAISSTQDELPISSTQDELPTRRTHTGWAPNTARHRKSWTTQSHPITQSETSTIVMPQGASDTQLKRKHGWTFICNAEHHFFHWMTARENLSHTAKLLGQGAT